MTTGQWVNIIIYIGFVLPYILALSLVYLTEPSLREEGYRRYIFTQGYMNNSFRDVILLTLGLRFTGVVVLVFWCIVLGILVGSILGVLGIW